MLSVVISTYKRPESLGLAVDSLIHQKRAPNEIVLVRWGGDLLSATVISELRERVEDYAPEIVLIEVVSLQNTVSAKENAGIQAAHGNIICFMDDDAVAREEWLERLERHYADSDVGAVGGRDVVWNGRSERRVTRVGRLQWFGRIVGNHHEHSVGVQEVDFLKGCNMSFRREAITLIDPLLIGEVAYGFEIDLGLAVRDQGRRIVYDPNVAVDHYPSTSMSARLPNLAYITNHNQTFVLLKHLPSHRQLAFLVYTFLIGDKSTVGVLRIPLLIARDHWPKQSILAHLAGKVQGVKTYLRWRQWAASRG